MFEFMLKSTICLGALYHVYIIFLKGLKTFEWNRYFLLGALLISVLIPFVQIPAEINQVAIINHEKLNTLSDAVSQADESLFVSRPSTFTLTHFMLILYWAISIIFLLRIGLNLWKMLKTTRTSDVIVEVGYKFVLMDKKTIPYSFLKYIFINKEEYESNQVHSSVLQHELVHVQQFHSWDIIIVELYKILVWVNPFIWLVAKSIKLNHEFIADKSVMQQCDIRDYQETLLQTVLRNCSSVLVCNFNVSFTKQRLKMMTAHYSKTKAIANYIFSTIALTLIVAVLTSSTPKDFEYKLNIGGVNGNYTKEGLRQTNFDEMKISTNRMIKVEEFEVILARGKRPVHYDKGIQGNRFDLRKYSKDTRDGDRIVIVIKKISNDKIELTQNNSILTIPILFDN